jgi:hypothetical protein
MRVRSGWVVGSSCGGSSDWRREGGINGLLLLLLLLLLLRARVSSMVM